MSSYNKQDKQGNKDKKEKMIKQQLIRRGITQEKVLEAMRKVPREKFVPSDKRHLAYEDHPIPIAHEQTISQPYIVAMMTEALELEEHHTVLEVGAGSGYQAAVLGEIAKEVHSIERISGLAEEAKHILDQLNYDNVIVEDTDSVSELPDELKFDRIIVTAAAPKISDKFIERLTTGGKLVIPVGSIYFQELVSATKKTDGSYNRKSLGGCRFVPLKGDDGF